MKRKIICLFTILCLALSLAACGASKEQEQPSAAESSDAESESEEESSVAEESSEAEESSKVEESSAAEESSAEEESSEAESSSKDEPAAPEAEPGPAITFEAVDLDGNPVRSEDLFAENKITMVNLWGTFCGPCIGEMPDLEVLRTRLEEKDCGIVGVVIDIGGPDDAEMIADAKDIIEKTGVTYLNLIAWDEIWGQLPAEFVPTTYFFNSEGQIIGEALIGARGADDYEAYIDSLLN